MKKNFWNLENVTRFINLKELKEEFKKLGVNFISAGMVGVFINHLVGSKLSTMFTAASWLCFVGVIFLIIGLLKLTENTL